MKPRVRILIVTEDWVGVVNGGFLRWVDQQPQSDAIGDNSREFHLGEFIRVLSDTQWVGFDIEITRAHRTAGSASLSEAQLKADRGADVIGFRFNQPFTVQGGNRTLSDYDMVLFFGVQPGSPSNTTAAKAEVEAIAQFMESGGGFFATGDHADLGATLAGAIPRVRSMRRWWANGGPGGEPAAPPPLTSQRIDTTRPGSDGVTNFEDQSDEHAQPIEPMLYPAGLGVRDGYVAFRSFPHPLLCSPEGMVKWLPDHMHEGMVEVPDNLATRTFSLGGMIVREYPDYSAHGGPAYPLAPVVVATGQVLAGTTSPVLDDDNAHTGGTDPAEGRTFGVIGAWDGHLVNKGRVVVDSTFHHFFDINLTGDRYLQDEVDEGGGFYKIRHAQKLHGFYVPEPGGWVPNEPYSKIMWYFRNIVYWLIPAQRKARIWWDVLATIARRPQLKEELLEPVRNLEHLTRLNLDHYFYFGQLAERYLAKARGHCAKYNVLVEVFQPRIPWWEWIQDEVDIWNPRPMREEGRVRSRRQLDGAIGIGPRKETLSTLALGAALVSAAVSREALRDGVEEKEALAQVDKAFDMAMEQLRRQLEVAMRNGRDTYTELERAMKSTRQAAGHRQP